MSGLEVVGVVLGAIPIVIMAVEKYRERQTRIAFRNKDPYVLRLIQSLRDQHYLLVSDIRLTLNGAGVDYDTLSTGLLPTLFRDPNIAEAVKEYLGSDSDVYLQAVERCRVVLAGLVGRIEGLGSVSDLDNLVRTYGCQRQLPKKIRFPIKRDELDRQIQDLDNATMMLRRISDNMTALRVQVSLQTRSRQISRLTSALSTVRNYARRLYSAVASAYPSHCHPHHEARLFLRSRSYFLERASEDKLWKDFTFTVLLSPAMSAAGSTNSYRTDIKVAKGDDGPDEQSTQISTCSRVVIQPPTPPTTAEPTRAAMDDLCKSIRRAKNGGIVLDLQVSERNCLMYCHLQRSGPSSSMHLVVEPDGFVTLEELLVKPDASWLPNHRIALSLTVASSLLQLVSTPWLPSPLTSSSVWFSRSAVQSAMLDLSAIPEPFVEERFRRPAATGTGCPACGVKECMLELGILLLEIAHWKTIDDYGKDMQNKGLPASTSRYDLAKAWMDASRYLILKVHWDLIMRCIENTFATSGPDLNWDDVVFRKSVAELVVKPLQENCIQHLQ
ncbi:hypothetical protein BDW68DRAFT_178687 [Aspergillus falconensis]